MSQSIQNVPRDHARTRANLPPLFFGLLGGPTAWALHLFANYILSSRRCFPDAEGRIPWTQLSSGSRFFMAGVDALALAVAAASALVSYFIWRAATKDMSSPARHKADAILERTKFLSFWGMIGSGLFLLALLFDIAGLALLERCG